MFEFACICSPYFINYSFLVGNILVFLDIVVLVCQNPVGVVIRVVPFKSSFPRVRGSAVVLSRNLRLKLFWRYNCVLRQVNKKKTANRHPRNRQRTERFFYFTSFRSILRCGEGSCNAIPWPFFTTTAQQLSSWMAPFGR